MYSDTAVHGSNQHINTSSNTKQAAADKWYLEGDDAELAILQQYIHWYVFANNITNTHICIYIFSANVDMNKLWSDSKVVNEIEFNKLKLKLSRAGLF